MLENNWHKKEEPFLSMSGLGGGSFRQVLTASPGEITYLDEVFSTFVYDGNGGTQSINNGIDLAGEGGMVWLKRRNTANDHYIGDTARGVGKVLLPNENIAQLNATASSTFASFDSSGFTVGGNSGYNGSSDEMCSWTFRKCPGFFDVVTYTGNGSHRDISHNLGSEPGSIWIKRTDSSESWIVYHRSLHPGGGGTAGTAHFAKLELESSGAQYGGTLLWSSSGGGEDHTSTTFHVSSHGSVNANGGSFVAYIFAHNDDSFGESRNEAVIKCGSYTGTGSANITETLGFEPQWLLVKNISTASQDWTLVDTMRGFTVGTVDERFDVNNNSNGESSFNVFEPTPRGFRLGSSVLDETNKNGDTHIYIAIARPHKPPTAGTDVFLASTTGTNTTINTGFNVDWAIIMGRGGTDQVAGTRLLGSSRFLEFNKADSQSTSSANHKFDNSDSFVHAYGASNPITWMFGRAAKVFDVVTYKGTGSSGLVVNHNLKTTPELLIFKNRTSGSTNWFIVNSDQYGNWNTAGAELLSQSFITFGSSSFTINTTGTSSNASGQEYVGYLFASYAGVSKVGTYTGSSGDVNVDCGFTNGARFVLIKHYDRGTGWFVLDTVRGIVSGNDPFIYWGTQTAEDSSYDIVDPYSAGFTVPSGAPLGVNENGQTFLFVAIA